MRTKSLNKIKKRIDKIKACLLIIGEMRPGSLTLQYKNPKEKKGAYYQLSYTYKMKSHTEYIRPNFMADIKNQINVYKIFKKLIEEWISLAIEHSRLKLSIAKNKKNR